MLQSNERIDQLYAEDIKIIQSSEVFSFSLDAVLLVTSQRFPNGDESLICVLEMVQSACLSAVKLRLTFTRSSCRIGWLIWPNAV